MKIAINALSAKTGGGVTYLNRLIYYLREVDEQNEYYIIVAKDNRRKIIAFEDTRFHVIEVRIRSLLHRLLYEEFVLPILLKRLDIDVLYAPADLAPLMVRCILVVGVQHQHIYYRHLEHLFSPTEKIRHRILRILAWHSLRRADKVIFISESMREHVSKSMDLPLAKSRTVLHGVEFGAPQSDGQMKSQRGIGDQFILSVSSLARHKNFETLIEAYARLRPELRKQYALLIVGRKTNRHYYKDLVSLAEDLEIADRVIFLGEVTGDELALLYRNATLFVFPSKLEGFGLPPLEAMAAGVPVIASNAPAVPEVVGNAALLFNPDDADELRSKMEEVLSDLKLREELIKKGLERAKQFSWEKCAEETLAVFQEVYDTHKRKK